MENYNDITIMSLEYFLAEKPTLEWLLTGVTGQSVTLSPTLKTAMPWENIIGTPDIRAESEDGSTAYHIHVGRYGVEDILPELRRAAEKEFSKFKEVHTLLFLDGRAEEDAARPAYSVTREGRYHYHILSVAVNPTVAPISPEILKFLDFLGGRNEELWKEEEPFRSLLERSSYQPGWADILRWRRKKVYQAAHEVTLSRGIEERTAQTLAKKAEQAFKKNFIQENIDEIISILLEMVGNREMFPPETLEVALEIPVSTIEAIQLEGHLYTEEDMRAFYLSRYRNGEG